MKLREMMEDAHYKHQDWIAIAEDPEELARSGATKEQAQWLINNYKLQYDALREVLGVKA